MLTITRLDVDDAYVLIAGHAPKHKKSMCRCALPSQTKAAT
jgi:hypothetical protein